MKILTVITVVIVAALHGWFLVLEMFLWQHEIGLTTFSLTPEQASQSAVLAGNQGLYNGFLAAGLLWGLIRNKPDFILFFLLCVIAAGIYGALTVSPSILFVQAAPALIALFLTVFSARHRIPPKLS